MGWKSDFLQNGVGITISEDLRDIEICFTVDLSVVAKMKYPIVDLGKRVSGSRVEPMNQNSTYESGQYCFIQLTLQKHDINQLFLISRESDWESKDQESVYSAGDLVILSVMFILCTFTVIILIIYEIREMGTSWEQGRFMNIFFILAMLVRGSFFLAFLISQPEDEETWWEFVGVELPILFYLSALSVSAMLWSNVTAVKAEENNTPLYTLIGNCILYLLFIALAIANSLVKDSASYSCYGRIYNEPDTSTNDAIKIAYRAVLSAAALLVAGLLSFWGSTVLITLFGIEKSENDHENMTKWRKRLAKKWFLVIFVCCLSILLQCVFFIVYTLVTNSGTKYALFLIPIEIMPIWFIFAVLHWNFFASKSSAMSPTGQDTTV